MRRSTELAVAVLCVASLATGCQRVNQQKTVELDTGDIKAAFIVDAPSSSQNITLTVTPSGTPVDVYIVLEKDRAAAEKAIAEDKTPPSSLAAKQKISAETTVTATVPAKEAYAVLVANSTKATSVGLKLMAK